MRRTVHQMVIKRVQLVLLYFSLTPFYLHTMAYIFFQKVYILHCINKTLNRRLNSERHVSILSFSFFY